MKLFLFIVFQFAFNQIWSQHSWHLNFSPVGIDISNNIEEHALGIYDVKNNFRLSQEFGITYRKVLVDQLSIDFGVCLRKINYNFDYIIHDPFHTELILFTQNRFHNRLMVYPHLGFSYSVSKFIVEFGFEPGLTIFKKTNIRTLFGSIEFFVDPNTGKSATFSIIERTYFVDTAIKWATPVFSVNYNLSSNFAIRFTSLFKPYGEYYFYVLDIQGRTPDMPNGTFQLNNTRINNKLGYVFLGITYQMFK